MNKVSFLLAFVILTASVTTVIASDGADAAQSTVTVTDGTGRTFTFEGPVDSIVTIGVGVTATVIDLGALDRIVVCDSYSRNNPDSVFDGLRERVDRGLASAGGNIYDSGKDQLRNDIVDAADPGTGTFDRERDVVFVTGSDAYRANIVPYLEDKGFVNVMQWYNITGYDDLVRFAETVSLVCTGHVEPVVGRMVDMVDYIDSTVSASGHDRAEAFYVTHSGGSFRVGNTDSVSTSMISAAGGDVVTLDPDEMATTYVANITELVDGHPGVTVFVDDVIASDPGRLESLMRLTGDSTVVPLDQIWNNYSTLSIDGVWMMASAMYPDLFDGDVPDLSSDGSDVTVYLLASLAVASLICVLSVPFLRGGSR
ncbi:MAG: ABC transporter substrate-binding protein [Candidatus Methanomethylophilaceae archaeon]|nr:ABC transporter substrate-binding protein [Candidatus Methanomethylophilaceae archaeon]